MTAKARSTNSGVRSEPSSWGRYAVAATALGSRYFSAAARTASGLYRLESSVLTVEEGDVIQCFRGRESRGLAFHRLQLACPPGSKQCSSTIELVFVGPQKAKP